eukprot:2300215-Prymnesium_polylepis.1
MDPAVHPSSLYFPVHGSTAAAGRSQRVRFSERHVPPRHAHSGNTKVIFGECTDHVCRFLS